MYYEFNSAMLIGMEAVRIKVECDIRNGLPVIAMVGDLSPEVREAKSRAITAIKNAGYVVPPRRITINFSPADIRKTGSALDLAIALAVLGALNEIHGNYKRTMAVGELSLDGAVNEIKGVVSMSQLATACGMEKLIVPKGNVNEAALMHDNVIGVENIEDLLLALRINNSTSPKVKLESEKRKSADFMSAIKGQQVLKRAAEIALAGKHHFLIVGPPGCGKSLVAKSMKELLPSLSFDEIIELTKIYSISGLLDDKAIIRERPFRAPHHSTTVARMVGGGLNPKSGEISLAHNGILFLDEVNEFKKETIENLRVPLENRKIRISRVNNSYEFPADFQLVAAMNPCPCGYYPDRNKCNCSEKDIERYRNKLSGPIMDRIDIFAQAEKVKYSQLESSMEDDSYNIEQNIERARKIQQIRYKNESYSYNADLDFRHIDKYCIRSEAAEKSLETAYNELELSVRAYHKVIKVARTVADLEASEKIEEDHVLEALFYRRSTMKG